MTKSTTCEIYKQKPVNHLEEKSQNLRIDSIACKLILQNCGCIYINYKTTKDVPLPNFFFYYDLLSFFTWKAKGTLFGMFGVFNMHFVFCVLSGRCGHGSPCEQLCYELHDGMYECDCTEGFELNKNGYSCQGKILQEFHLHFSKISSDIRNRATRLKTNVPQFLHTSTPEANLLSKVLSNLHDNCSLSGRISAVTGKLLSGIVHEAKLCSRVAHHGIISSSSGGQENRCKAYTQSFR